MSKNTGEDQITFAGLLDWFDFAHAQLKGWFEKICSDELKSNGAENTARETQMTDTLASEIIQFYWAPEAHTRTVHVEEDDWFFTRGPKSGLFNRFGLGS